MTNSQIFTAAWTAARNGALRFGGSARAYFAQALKAAYTAAQPTPCYVHRAGTPINKTTYASVQQIVSEFAAKGAPVKMVGENRFTSYGMVYDIALGDNPTDVRAAALTASREAAKKSRYPARRTLTVAEIDSAMDGGWGYMGMLK